jgi:hypothetical protein
MTVVVLKWSHGRVLIGRADCSRRNRVGRGQGLNFYIGKNAWISS